MSYLHNSQNADQFKIGMEWNFFKKSVRWNICELSYIYQNNPSSTICIQNTIQVPQTTRHREV
jgi:hypothetical protein